MPDGVEFTSNADAVLEILSRATESALEIVGGIVEDQAGEYVMRAKGPLGNAWPTDLLVGLRQSITHAIEDGVLTVGSNQQIAPYIELGTGKHYDPPEEWIRYHGNDGHTKGGLDMWYYYDIFDHQLRIGRPMKATPYLRPAFLDHAEDIREIVERELKDAN